MAFDSVKEELFEDSPYGQLSLLKTKIVSIDSARLSLSTLKTDMMMRDAYLFVGEAFNNIAETRNDIIQRQNNGERLNQEIDSEFANQEKHNEKVKELSNKYLIDYDF